MLGEPLRETLGVIVFQDQVLAVATALAGFSIGEAEGLRRAMSRKRSLEAIEAFRGRFVEGGAAQGVSGEVANAVFDKLVGFSGFGFPKSHAAAFGLLAYQSAWLRHHYPAEFLCALLNAQPMGFYPPASLVRDAQRRGVEVRSPDVNLSAARCALEGEAVRVGLSYVRSLGDEEAAAVAGERERGGPVRGSPGARAANRARPAAARGARGLGRLRLVRPAPGAALGARLHAARPDGPRERGRGEPARAAARPDGRDTRPARAFALGADARRLPDDEPVGGRAPADAPAAAPARRDAFEPRAGGGTSGQLGGVAGMAVARQRPATANGVVFMLLEDEHGQVNLIVPPRVYERFRPLVRSEPLLLARGRFERVDRNRNVLVRELESLGPLARRCADEADVFGSLPAAHHFGHR